MTAQVAQAEKCCRTPALLAPTVDVLSQELNFDISHISGQSLAGAGGGGFMYLLTKEENAFDIVSNLLKELQVRSLDKLF